MKTESENVIHKEEKNRTDNLNNFFGIFLVILVSCLVFCCLYWRRQKEKYSLQGKDQCLPSENPN